MQRYLSHRKYYQPAHLLAVWQFAYRLLPLYLWTHVWGHSVCKFPPQPVERVD